MLILRDQMDIGDGTSASSPIFAGILSLLNQYLLSMDEQPIGLANPFLYTAAAEFPSSFNGKQIIISFLHNSHF